MKRDLIYDIGMNNGDDTAFYLIRGYRVLAIEANPELAEAGGNGSLRKSPSVRLKFLRSP